MIVKYRDDRTDAATALECRAEVGYTLIHLIHLLHRIPTLPMTRKRICQLGSPLDNFYSREFWKGAAGEAERLDMDLVYLAGGMQGIYFNGFSETCELTESRSTLTYQFLDPSRFDGVLVWGAQWGHDADDALISSTMTRFSPLPIVSVGWSDPGIHAVIQDNYNGMRQMVSHLIKEHGHRNIAYLKSESTFAQREAEERFQAYLDELEAQGITPDPRLIVYGHEIEQKRADILKHHAVGENWAILAMHELLEDRGLQPGWDFTAIATRDDFAALTVISELQRRGVAVPGDVAVSGFDDLVAGRCSNPPLSTVTQSFSGQAAQGMRLLDALLRGEQPEAITHMEPSRPVIRESCGCLNRFMRSAFEASTTALDREETRAMVVQPIETVLAKYTENQAALPDIAQVVRRCMHRLRDLGIDPMEMAGVVSALSSGMLLPDKDAVIRAVQMLVGDISQRLQLQDHIDADERQDQLDNINRDIFRTYNLDQVLDSVEAELPVIGAKGCSIILFADPLDPLAGSRVLFSSSHGKRREGSGAGAPLFPTREILPEGFWPDGSEPFSLYVEPLYFAGRRLGYLVMEHGDSDGKTYTSLASRLASVLEGAFLVRSLNDKQTELEKAYSDILELSNRDALTGLFNRRAFQRELQGEKYRMDRYSTRDYPIYSLLFLDLDNFKYYNDTFGHGVGDMALKAFAELISSCIRTTDVVARFGGDEFVIMLTETDLPDAEILASRILGRIQETDHLHVRIEELSQMELIIPPEQLLSCSIGIACYNRSENPEQTLQSADRALYEAKTTGKGRYCIYRKEA